MTQAVFLLLAQKAATLPEKTVIAGWLYRATHFAAGHVLRAERRRRLLHTKAAQMETVMDNPRLAKRGVVLPLTAISTALASSSVQAAHPYLISSVTAMAAGGLPANTSIIATMKGTLKMIMFSKIKVTAATAGMAALYCFSVLLVATALAQPSKARLTQGMKPLTDWEAADLCFVNLKKIGTGARVYARSHKGVLPSDFATFKDYLDSPNLLICPRDPKKPVMTDWPQFDANKVSYELVTPGASVGQPYKDYVVCTNHSHRCLVDASVQRGPKWQK